MPDLTDTQSKGVSGKKVIRLKPGRICAGLKILQVHMKVPFMISRFQFISSGPPGTHLPIIKEVCNGGCKWIQLRIKKGNPKYILQEASLVKEICRAFSSKFIINDYLDVAIESGADGIHVGKNDMHPDEVRKFTGKNFIIGATANNERELKTLQDTSVDYIGLGPYRYTKTKENLAPVLGKHISLLATKYPQIPVIGIGALQHSDVRHLISGGVHGVAVSSAISRADDVNESTQRFIREIKRWT